MDLKHYLAVLGRRKRVIAVTAAVTVVVAIIGTLLATPSYEAAAMLRIAAASGASAEYVGYNDIMYADRLMNTYSKIATNEATLKELAQKLDLQKAPDVVAEIPANTELISIKVEDRDPALAAHAANTLADILVADFRSQYAETGKTTQGLLSDQLATVKADLDQAWRNYEGLVAKSPKNTDEIETARRNVELEQDRYAKLSDQYEQSRIADTLRAGTISIVQQADVPKVPSKPRKEINLALGLLIGLIGGVALAFLLEHLDTTVYTTRQIEETTELSTLAQIPSATRQYPMHLFNSNSPHEEAFRRLRANILMLGQDVPLRTLMVTSAGPGEGKSTVVANLARMMAKLQRRIVVVDCDLRLPSLQRVFHLPNDTGLSSVLRGETTLEQALQFSNIPGVLVLTSGPIPGDPAELLSSPRMAVLIKRLADQCDMVLLDTPALLAVADAGVLAQLADGVVLVVGRALVREEALRTTREQLANLKARLVGVVVNHAERGNGNYYRYGKPGVQAHASSED
jgi:polysaccharide biosynthesis transport protein